MRNVLWPRHLATVMVDNEARLFPYAFSIPIQEGKFLAKRSGRTQNRSTATYYYLKNYWRVVATLHRILSCCVGKTWSL